MLFCRWVALAKHIFFSFSVLCLCFTHAINLIYQAPLYIHMIAACQLNCACDWFKNIRHRQLCLMYGSIASAIQSICVARYYLYWRMIMIMINIAVSCRNKITWFEYIIVEVNWWIEKYKYCLFYSCQTTNKSLNEKKAERILSNLMFEDEIEFFMSLIQ